MYNIDVLFNVYIIYIVSEKATYVISTMNIINSNTILFVLSKGNLCHLIICLNFLVEIKFCPKLIWKVK